LRARKGVVMEREIDLRVYVLAVVRRWWLIGGMAVVAGVIALVVSVFRPPSYEAEAMVAFTVPQYVANFDPRFETVTKVTFPYKAFPDLAMSDQVLGALREKVVEKWPNR
jgi:LPS O-antigen subunit length determinant protein (WzzB/FepE family)